MRLADFVTVEFARAWQAEQGASAVDPEIVAELRAQGLPPGEDERLLAYAEHLLERRVLDEEGRSAPSRLRLAWQVLTWLAPVLGVLLGGALLTATLPPNDVRPVNVFRVLGEAVVLPGALLVLSAVLAPAPGLPRIHWATWLVAAAQRGTLETRLGRLAGTVLRRSGVAGPLLAGLSHRVWLAVLGSYLLVALARFAFDDYLFSWSSTLPVTADGVWVAFSALAAPLDWVPGLDAPSPEQIHVSQYASLEAAWPNSTGDAARDEAMRKGWWALLLGIVATWGLLPRALALLWSEWRVRRGVAAALASPEHRALLAALASPSVVVRSDGPVQRQSGSAAPSVVAAAPAAATAATTAAPAVPPAGRGLDIVAFAVEPPGPATLDQLGLGRLGLSGHAEVIPDDDDDEAVQRLLARLADPSSGPGGAVLVFPLQHTPDRLRAAFVQDVVGALGDRPVHLLLTGAAEFARGPRGARLAERLAAWTAAAGAAGVPAGRVRRDDAP